MEIKKVYRNGKGSKIVVIPAKSEIQPGDYVQIEKLNSNEQKKFVFKELTRILPDEKQEPATNEA
jgi:hypothetical protein